MILEDMEEPPPIPKPPKALLRDMVLYRGDDGKESLGFIVGIGVARGKRLIDIQPIDLDSSPLLNLGEDRVLRIMKAQAFGERGEAIPVTRQ